MSNRKVKDGLPKTKEGLPKEAFAIVGDASDTSTWKLPHHTRSIFRSLGGKLNVESTVDWDRMSAAVAAISLVGFMGSRVKASPEDILSAAHHLAGHYRKAAKSLPNALAVLV